MPSRAAGRGRPTADLDAVCEEILLSAGSADEAYERYGLVANRRGTYLATFRAVARKYSHKSAADILADLVRTTPGEEGKWFAATKEAGLYDEALALAAASLAIRRPSHAPRGIWPPSGPRSPSTPAFLRSAGSSQATVTRSPVPTC